MLILNFEPFRLVLGDLKCGKTDALDGVEEIVGRLGPSEGPWIGIDGFDVGFDCRLQFQCGPMGAAPDLLFG